MRARALGLGCLAMMAAPTGAAPIEFSGTASLDAGYATNPFLQPGESDGAFSLGGSIQTLFGRRDARGETRLGLGYNRTEYLNGGFPAGDGFGVSLSRDHTFSERLSGSANLSYDNSRNVFAQPDDIIDTTTLGARRESVSGSGSLQWQATQRDVLSFSASATKADFGSAALGDFETYSGSAVYRRVLNSQTNVGLSMSVSQTNSSLSGDTTTYSPRVVLDHQFDEAWKFNGSLGLLYQRTKIDLPPPFPNFTSKSRSIGFDANLCRTLPRTTLCVAANRDTQASGLGGARTATTASITYNYRLTERESISASVVAADTKSLDRTFFIPKERYISADARYSRQISRRLDAGITGAYRRRDLSGLPDADGFTVTLNLIARIGRLR